MKIRMGNYGFTLLELLIVIALIAILVSMVLMATMGSWTDSNKRLTESTMDLLEGSLEEYRDFAGCFPEPNSLSAVSFSDDQTLHSASLYDELDSVPDSKKILERVAGSQISLVNNYRVFIDAWKKPLNYLYDPVLNNFPVIISAGPDKKFDTADDITNKK